MSNMFTTYYNFNLFFKKIIFCFCLFTLSFSQFSDLEITFEVNQSKIKDSEHYILEEFNDLIKKYIIFNSFSNEYDLDIPLKIHFIYEGINFAGENKYNMLTFQSIISNTTDQYFYIRTTSIPYHKGKTIYFNDSIFDPIASLFDYYVSLFIAYELDSYGLLLGEQYYNKAIEISSMGATSSYSSGWDNRNEIAKNIKNNEFLRNARFSFYNSLDLYNEEEFVKNDIKESMNTFLYNLNKVKEKYAYEKNTLKLLDSFFREITELFVLTNNKEGIKFLYNFDSKNKEFYGEYLKRNAFLSYLS